MPGPEKSPDPEKTKNPGKTEAPEKSGRREAPGRPPLPPSPDERVGLLDGFSVQLEVEPIALHFLGDTQAHDAVHDLEDDEGPDAAV